MNEPEGQTKVKLQKTHALTVFRAGQQAFSEIEGLRGLVLRGLFLNYLIFFCRYNYPERVVLFSGTKSIY